MIPSIKAGTEIPYLINANVWGQEDENNSFTCMLWRTLSASLFLSKQPMNQHYVTTGCRNLHLLNLLLYWEAQGVRLKTRTPQFQRARAVPLQAALQAGSAAKSHSSASLQQPGPCSGLLLLPRAITNTFLCQVSSTPAQFPSTAHYKLLGQHRGENKQLVAQGGQSCCSSALPEPAQDLWCLGKITTWCTPYTHSLCFFK